MLVMLMVGGHGLSGRLMDVVTECVRPFRDGPGKGFVADIGCDHGHLAAELCQRGREVVASDISEAPLERAKHHFAELGLTGRFVLGDGVNAIDDVVETACVCGMGGYTTAAIVREAMKEKNKRPRRFVVQPTQHFIAQLRDLRIALYASGYLVTAEVFRNDFCPESYEGVRKKNKKPHIVTIAADYIGDDAKRRRLTEVDLLVGPRHLAHDATPDARRSYLEHHRDWLRYLEAESVAFLKNKPPNSRLLRVRRWHRLLEKELLLQEEEEGE